MCAEKRKQKSHFDRKIPFHDLNESKSLPFNHLLKKAVFLDFMPLG